MNISQFEGGLFYGLDFLMLLMIIMFLINSVTLKNDIKKAGKNYLLFETEISKIKINKIIKFIPILILLIFIPFIFLLGISFLFMFIPMLLLSILFIIMFIHGKKFDNVNGIYENGIIASSDKLLEWKDIHSYIITDNNIFGYYKNGEIFECKNVSNIEEIKCLFEKNRIIERNER